MNLRYVIYVVWALVMCVPLRVQAQEVPLRMLTVVGEAEREIAPDQALLQVTVQAEDRELQKAKRLHDEKMQKLFVVAGDLQIERKHIKTQHASIHPQYDYRDNKQVFRSYVVSNSLQLTIKRMNSVGELMQKLVAAGFDQLGGVQYTIDNDLAYRDEVMLDALDNAKAKAEKMASRAGVVLGKPVQISQGYQHSQPVPVMRAAKMEMAMSASAGASEGVQPPEGMMTIQGTVTVSYEIKD